jgi:hypothetical protein
MPRFAGAPPAQVGDRRWSLRVSTMRNGEIVFVVYCVVAAAWIAWKTWG